MFSSIISRVAFIFTFLQLCILVPEDALTECDGVPECVIFLKNWNLEDALTGCDGVLEFIFFECVLRLDDALTGRDGVLEG